MNHYRGDVPITVPGPDGTVQHLTLRLGTNEFVMLEEILGVKGGALMMGLSKNIGFRELRTIFRVGLSRSLPDITDEQAGDMIDQIGGITALTDLLTKAIQAAVPSPEEEGKAQDVGNAMTRSPGSAS